MAWRQVLNCSRLHCWPEEWRPDPRGFLFPPFLVDFPSCRLHTKSIHSETQNPLFLLHLLKYHIGEKKNGANIRCCISQFLSSASLQHCSALWFSYLVKRKTRAGNGETGNRGSPSSCQACLLLGPIGRSPDVSSWEILCCISSIFPLSKN